MSGKTKIDLLALQGGGALGSYQAGLILGLLENTNIKFKAISGVSAGAINAMYILDALKGSEGLSDAPKKVSLSNRLYDLWINKSVDNDTVKFGKLKICFKFLQYLSSFWLFVLSFGRYKSPLLPLLEGLNFDDINASDIVCFTTSMHVSGLKHKISTQPHLSVATTQASASIPFMLPPARLDDGYYVDGAAHNLFIRQHVARNPALVKPLDSIKDTAESEQIVLALTLAETVRETNPNKSWTFLRKYLTEPYIKELDIIEDYRKQGRKITLFEIELKGVSPLLIFWPSRKLTERLFAQGKADALKYMKESPDIL